MPKIYEDGVVKRQLFIKLEQDGDEVDLVLVDGNGKCCELILTVNEDDGLILYEDLPGDSPFPLDDAGAIKIAQ